MPSFKFCDAIAAQERSFNVCMEKYADARYVDERRIKYAELVEFPPVFLHKMLFRDHFLLRGEYLTGRKATSASSIR